MGSRTLAARWSAGCPRRPRRRPRWTRAAQPQVPDGGRVAGGDHHGGHGDTEPEGDQLDQEGVAVERPERRSRPRPDGPASITHAPGPSNACGKSPASRVVLSPRRATKRTVSGETIQWPTRMQVWLERSLRCGRGFLARDWPGSCSCRSRVVATSRRTRGRRRKLRGVLDRWAQELVDSPRETPRPGRCPQTRAVSGGHRNASASACEGVLKPRVCRGRPFSSAAMASSSA
jgi:hypothetical protein